MVNRQEKSKLFKIIMLIKILATKVKTMQATLQIINWKRGTMQVIVIVLKFPFLYFRKKQNSLNREEDGSKLNLCSMEILLITFKLLLCCLRNYDRIILNIRKGLRGQERPKHRPSIFNYLPQSCVSRLPPLPRTTSRSPFDLRTTIEDEFTYEALN